MILQQAWSHVLVNWGRHCAVVAVHQPQPFCSRLWIAVNLCLAAFPSARLFSTPLSVPVGVCVCMCACLPRGE